MSTQVGRRNRALRVHGPGDLRLEEVPVPITGDHEALVKIGYGGICGSDLHYARDGAVGLFVLRDPMVLGHEVVGTVARAAADGSGPGEGQAVAIHPATSCGTCRWCLGGESRLCPQARYLGSAAHRPHTDGGFTDLLSVGTHRLVPVPDGLALRRAAWPSQPASPGTPLAAEPSSGQALTALIESPTGTISGTVVFNGGNLDDVVGPFTGTAKGDHGEIRRSIT